MQLTALRSTDRQRREKSTTVLIDDRLGLKQRKKKTIIRRKNVKNAISLRENAKDSLLLR